MAFGKIPRFSPSFSPSEAFIAARYLLRSAPDAENDRVVQKFEQRFADYIGAKHAVAPQRWVDSGAGEPEREGAGAQRPKNGDDEGREVQHRACGFAHRRQHAGGE